VSLETRVADCLETPDSSSRNSNRVVDCLGIRGSSNSRVVGYLVIPRQVLEVRLIHVETSSFSCLAAFGQPLQQPQQPSAFGQPSTGGGLFGNTNQQQQNQSQQNQQSPGSGFGSLFTKPPGGGFGSTAPTQQNQQQNPNPSNPLFGGGSGGGLFGNTNTQQQQQPTMNPLFGGGSGTGLFGGQKPPAPVPGFGALGTGGLFGNTQQQQQQPAQGGLFGNTNTQSQQQQQPSLFGGGSLFGGSTQQQQQPSLTASIDQPLPSTVPTSLPQLPSLAASLGGPKKKSNAFADIAARSSPRLGLGVGLNYAPPGPGSKLRGFGTSASTSTLTKNPFSLPPPGSPGKGSAPFSDSKSLLPSHAFSSGSGGSLQLLGGRQSVKKLVLDKRVDEDELHRLRNARADSASPARAREVRFNPALSVAAREKDNDPRRSASPAVTPTRAAPRPGSRMHDSANSSIGKTTTASPAQSTPLNPQEGEYWCLPPVADLQRLSFTDLQSVKDFTVGRVSFGTIQFLQPVDLTSVPSIADIPGKIVTFEHVECVLYPDERLKPPQGEGLNVPARIKLDRCWALDKSTREPIKDPNDTKHIQRLRKMREQEGAEFVGFDMETGVWEFTVQEF
jgi:nuclear pore complex protein Nup98-Nup96